ncbi:MAG TPA: transposase [Kofleriaceae bacterium]
MKKHVQQSFGTFSKTPDKNGQYRGARKGDKRNYKVRLKKGPRASERHEKRPVFASRHPIHVVVRAHEDVQPLRRKNIYRAIRRATNVVARRTDMRIVYYSIQNSHIHLLVEAADKTALAKGMQSFGVSAARHINSELHLEAQARGDLGAIRRRGPVIADRYHARILKTPREVRNCISYVMNNWRHHRADTGSRSEVDWYSSGPLFTGWQELEGRRIKLQAGFEPLVTKAPESWLLSVGWRKAGIVSWKEIPGPSTE